MPEKEYKHQLITKELDRNSMLLSLDHLLYVCEKNALESLETLFGWAWGYDFYNWTPQQIAVENLKNEIFKAEKVEWGLLGDNDIIITIPKFDVKIRYCHHSDIHLEYETQNDFIKEIIKYWRKNKWIEK